MAILTADQVTTNIVNQLKLLDPTVSAEIGTPERKIIEATAELIAGQQVDFSVLSAQTDVTTLSAGKLDAYLSMFNFGRQQATPSYGTVTFQRNVSTTTQIVLPRGTQVQANINSSAYPSLIFVTTDTVVLEIDTDSIYCTVQCTIAGTVGNIDSGAVVGFAGLQSITGISSVTNAAAFSGGADQETDDAYRTRFQNSFLRNISGTSDMFLALAVAANSVTIANVVGPISRYQEYVQVPLLDDVGQDTDGDSYDPTGLLWPHKRTSAESTIPYSKYTYPVNYYLTDSTLDPGTADFFRTGADFVFNTPPIDATGGGGQVTTTPVTSPNVTFLNPYDADVNVGGNPSIPSGGVLLLEQAYMSIHSRNDVDNGVYNCVDVFVNGGNLVTSTSIEVVPGNGHDLQESNSNSWTYQNVDGFGEQPITINFTRFFDGIPAAQDRGTSEFQLSMVQPCYWQPVTGLPQEVQIGQDTYYQANYYNDGDDTYYNQFDGDSYTFPAHFIFVQETNNLYGTIRCRNGIEWFLAGNNYLPGQLTTDPTDGSSYTGDLIDSLVGQQFTLESYVFDQNISDLQAIMEANKQTTQDVLVHRARYRYIVPIVTVMYSFGVTQAVVNSSVIAALAQFFGTQYYGSTIQLSDILQVIHNVPGIDNVRFANLGGDAVQETSPDGNTIIDYQTNDFFLQDNELAASPINTPVIITVRAQNTWTT